MRSAAFGRRVTRRKTGLVAIYENGDGPTILVRTELDALPMEEKTGLAYASHDKTSWNGWETCAGGSDAVFSATSATVATSTFWLR